MVEVCYLCHLKRGWRLRRCRVQMGHPNQEKASFSFEDLFDAGAHPRLDAIIATAALELVKNHPELSREVNLRAQSISKEGKRLRGRQILRIIFEHYELDQSQGFTFSFTDLLFVNLKNDKQIFSLQRFH